MDRDDVTTRANATSDPPNAAVHRLQPRHHQSLNGIDQRILQDVEDDFAGYTIGAAVAGYRDDEAEPEPFGFAEETDAPDRPTRPTETQATAPAAVRQVVMIDEAGTIQVGPQGLRAEPAAADGCFDLKCEERLEPTARRRRLRPQRQSSRYGTTAFVVLALAAVPFIFIVARGQAGRADPVNQPAIVKQGAVSFAPVFARLEHTDSLIKADLQTLNTKIEHRTKPARTRHEQHRAPARHRSRHTTAAAAKRTTSTPTSTPTPTPASTPTASESRPTVASQTPATQTSVSSYHEAPAAKPTTSQIASQPTSSSRSPTQARSTGRSSTPTKTGAPPCYFGQWGCE